MKNPVVEVEFKELDQATSKGGVFAIKGFAQEYGLWDKVRAATELDPRRHKGKGYDPVVYVATFLFGFVCGGASMADFERLNEEEGLKKFLGIQSFPDQSTLAQWLRGIGSAGLTVLQEINRDFIAWAISRIRPERLLHAGELELFFDDTQLEVTGKCFEEAALNHEGNLTLSWQTLWVGPFLAGGNLGKGSRDCSECLQALLERNAALWQSHTSYLYADSGSGAGKYLELLEDAVDHYSVSYNKWTDGPERCAKELPETVWSAQQIKRWRDGKLHRVQHAWLQYQPSGCERPKLFCVTRHQRAEGELFWQYAFICCDSHRQQSASNAVDRHQLKGDRERMFSQVLSDMDLHHPPCQSLAANAVFYELAMLAHNMLQAIKLLYFPDKEQCVRIRTLLHLLMLIPVQFKRHARQLKAVCCVAGNWLPWWRTFADELLAGQYRIQASSA